MGNFFFKSDILKLLKIQLLILLHKHYIRPSQTGGCAIWQKSIFYFAISEVAKKQYISLHFEHPTVGSQSKH